MSRSIMVLKARRNGLSTAAKLLAGSAADRRAALEAVHVSPDFLMRLREFHRKTRFNFLATERDEV